ncbi:MAG TPA: TA system VapC family ribonuclease toxin [Candidatus Dormibacteraeota bacterium]|nr:TA system VapC family ribonuclease toxin [Candidatus Dormibacteraeota bacterium]
MLLDANLLLYAVDRESRFHGRAVAFLEEALSGPSRVGFPWPSLLAFLRITTHPRALRFPLDGAEAWGFVAAWLACPGAWIPAPAQGHAQLLQRLIEAHDLRGNLIADAHLAALAIEHGLPVVSADSDFARFPEIRWLNPLA